MLLRLPIFPILAVLLAAFSPVSRATAAPNYGAAAYTIIDNETGHILESVNGQKKRQVASLTKIATAVVVLDWSKANGKDLAETVVIPPEVSRIAGANPVGLTPGDFVSIRDLLYAALLQSDNAAAYTLANHVGRSLKATTRKGPKDLSPVDTFVAQMNALARNLRMDRTLFLNPHGLDPSKGTLPFSTTDNFAYLARYAMSNKGFRFFVSQKEREITLIRDFQQIRYLLRNTNELVGANGIDGVKTGRTAAAGDCLILSASRAPESRTENGRTLITPRRINVVLLDATDRFAVGRQLLARGWALEEQWAAQGRRADR